MKSFPYIYHEVKQKKKVMLIIFIILLCMAVFFGMVGYYNKNWFFWVLCGICTAEVIILFYYLITGENYG